MNIVPSKLSAYLDNGSLSLAEYSVLFVQKKDWLDDSEESIFFKNTLQKVIRLSKSLAILDLSKVVFPAFIYSEYKWNSKQSLYLKEAIFQDKSDFSYLSIKNKITFLYCHFYQKAEFNDTVFSNMLSFNHSIFHKGSCFSNAIFEKNTLFRYCEFDDYNVFHGTISSQLIDFTDSMIYGSLDLESSLFDYANFKNTKPYSSQAPNHLSSKKFANRETIRIIKNNFEQRNNIIDSNFYYKLEMEKYREDICPLLSLESLSWQKDFLKVLSKNSFKIFFNFFKSLFYFLSNAQYFVLSIHKIISDYSTSWLRVLIWVALFSLLVLFFHDGMPQDTATWYEVPNRAMELINPLNILKKDYKLYQGQEFWAMLVRVIAMYLFYQFAIAFRQNTRRK